MQILPKPFALRLCLRYYLITQIPNISNKEISFRKVMSSYTESISLQLAQPCKIKARSPKPYITNSRP